MAGNFRVCIYTYPNTRVFTNQSDLAWYIRFSVEKEYCEKWIHLDGEITTRIANSVKCLPLTRLVRIPQERNQ